MTKSIQGWHKDGLQSNFPELSFDYVTYRGPCVFISAVAVRFGLSTMDSATFQRPI